MPENWPSIVRQYRLRHSLTQSQLAAALGVAQRTISRWERAQDTPSLVQQKQLRDLTRKPDIRLSRRLHASVTHCPAPRALSRMPDLRLMALSQPAIDKRPSIVNWIGESLITIASGVLEEMLADRALQSSIAAGEIACVLTTTRSVLRTSEQQRIGAFQTTIGYFFEDGVLYSDALSMRTSEDVTCGYRAIPMDTAFDRP